MAHSGQQVFGAGIIVFFQDSQQLPDFLLFGKPPLFGFADKVPSFPDLGPAWPEVLSFRLLFGRSPRFTGRLRCMFLHRF